MDEPMSDAPDEEALVVLEGSLKRTVFQRLWANPWRPLGAIVALGFVAQMVAIRVSLRRGLLSGCETSKQCPEPSKCTAVGWFDDRVACRVDSAWECEQSKGCKKSGDCGVYVFDDASSGCRARNEQDCKQSALCASLGMCTFADNSCR